MNHDLELIESIARNYGVSQDTVRAYRGVRHQGAIYKFLSPISIKKLKERGYLSDEEQSREHRLGIALSLSFDALPEFRDDFYRSKEGILWYEFNVAVPCAMAGQMVSDLHQQIFEGATQNYPPAQKVALELHLTTTRNSQRFAESIRKGQARTAAKLRGRKFTG